MEIILLVCALISAVPILYACVKSKLNRKIEKAKKDVEVVKQYIETINSNMPGTLQKETLVPIMKDLIRIYSEVNHLERKELCSLKKRWFDPLTTFHHKEFGNNSPVTFDKMNSSTFEKYWTILHKIERNYEEEKPIITNHTVDIEITIPKD